MDYEVWSHDLGNLLRSYYYVKKVFQFVRRVINIIVKERVHSIFKNKVHIMLMQRDARYKTWYMCGVSYTILTLRNSCSVGYLLPSLEKFHSTTAEKSIRLFMDVAIHEVAWYVIKQKRWLNETAYYHSLSKKLASTRAMVLIILSRISWRSTGMGGMYTLSFMNPQNEKSMGVRLGDLGGHGMQPPRPIHLSENV
jgi:hypothetical protein